MVDLQRWAGLDLCSRLLEDKTVVQQVSSWNPVPGAWLWLSPIWMSVFLVSTRTFLPIRRMSAALFLWQSHCWLSYNLVKTLPHHVTTELCFNMLEVAGELGLTQLRSVPPLSKPNVDIVSRAASQHKPKPQDYEGERKDERWLHKRKMGMWWKLSQKGKVRSLGNEKKC